MRRYDRRKEVKRTAKEKEGTEGGEEIKKVSEKGGKIRKRKENEKDSQEGGMIALTRQLLFHLHFRRPSKLARPPPSLSPVALLISCLLDYYSTDHARTPNVGKPNEPRRYAPKERGEAEPLRCEGL